ncbi:unnamed protein product, partial [Prorocentrum cordatum]
ATVPMPTPLAPTAPTTPASSSFPSATSSAPSAPEILIRPSSIQPNILIRQLNIHWKILIRKSSIQRRILTRRSRIWLKTSTPPRSPIARRTTLSVLSLLGGQRQPFTLDRILATRTTTRLTTCPTLFMTQSYSCIKHGWKNVDICPGRRPSPLLYQ